MMSLNISDAAEAVLEGQAVHQEWVDEFMAGWFAPIQKMLAVTLVSSLPAEVRAQLNPDDLDVLMKEV